VRDTTAAPAAPASLARRPGGLTLVFRRDSVGLFALWIAFGSVLGEIALHARDYIDFDAGRYQRLAISIARTGSLIPRVNGVDIHSYSQLYPILIAPFFRHGLIVDDMKNVNLASAYIMSSACIPAFLLTRRVTRERWAPYLVAALTIFMPWIVMSLAMMTEIAAYPTAAWALFALVVALAVPSLRHDVLAALAVALAFFARGELLGLVIVFPLALAAYELGRAPGPGVGARVGGAARAIVRGHPVLVAVYGAVGVVALTLYVQGRLASVLGIYSTYQGSAHLDYGGLPRSIPEHLATFSLAFGVVPFVVSLAWIGANVVRPPTSRARHAFACVGACTAVVLFLQATNFDLVVNAYIHDRFLIYFVPVVLVGAVLAVTDERVPRWSLVPALLLVVVGFAAGAIPRVTWGDFPWLDLDTPISTVYRVLVFHLAGGSLTPVRVGLVVLAVGGTAAFVVTARSLGRTAVVAGTLGFMALAMVLTTWAVFQRTFDSPDRNARSISESERGRFDWIDQRVGPGSSVTALMYPISTDWFVSQQRWVDFVYFNKSIQRIGRIAGQDVFDYAGLWFPKLDLHLDARTGAVAESPTRWILQSDGETRFRVAGPAIAAGANGILVDAGRRWKLAWMTSGLYDDGWSLPGKTVVARLYSRAGQTEPELRTMSYVLRSPDNIPQRPITLSAQGKTMHAVATPDAITENIQVCVPAQGYAEIRLRPDGSSWVVPGDLATHESSLVSRRAGIFIASLGEADEIGGRC